MIKDILAEIEALEVEDKLRFGYYFWLEEFTRRIWPKTVVELGTYEGTSTQHLLWGLPADSRLVTVDKEKRIQIEPDPRLTILTGDDLSDEIFGQIPSGIDILFIDTDHTVQQLLKEILLYRKKFSPVCYVVLDDIHMAEMEPVWEYMPEPKYDLSAWHGSGFGLVIYNDR